MADTSERPAASAIPLTGILCATAGAVDATAYILFGGIFIANMTGNSVLFAVSVAMHDWQEAGKRIGVVFAFLAGIILAHLALRKSMHGRERRGRLLVLGLEFALLGALTWVSHPHTRTLLLILLAIAMGAQNDAFRNIGGIKLNTAFISGDLDDLGAALVDSKASGKAGQGRKRVLVFLTVWIAYAVGALLGAVCAFRFAEKSLWMPAGLVALAAAIVIQSASDPSALGSKQLSGTPN